MFTHLAWMTLLVAVQTGPPVQGLSEDYSPPDVQLPVPQYTNQPDGGDWFIFGGSFWGGGWRFADASAITGWWGLDTRTLELTYRKPIHETDNTRTFVVWGTQNGLFLEWYLGQGFAARMDLACSNSLLHLDLDWYPDWNPLENFALTIGFDPLRCRWDWAWKIIM